jgi:DNA-binding IclR family transcriptional regulator
VIIKIIQALKDLDGARISELADHLGQPKSSVHNYLSTLWEEKYVVKERQAYYVGLRFLDFGR